MTDEWNNTGDNRTNGRKTYPSASLSTTNPTCTGLGMRFGPAQWWTIHCLPEPGRNPCLCYMDNLYCCLLVDSDSGNMLQKWLSQTNRPSVLSLILQVFWVWLMWAGLCPLALQYLCFRMFRHSGAPRIQTARCSDREYIFSRPLSAGAHPELFITGGGADPEFDFKNYVLEIMS